MAQKTFESCLEKIFADIDKRRTVDYGDKNSVRRYNAASDRIYANFAYIDANYPERIEELMKYVDCSMWESVWYFIFGINKMKNATLEQKMRCIDELRKMEDNPNATDLQKFTIPISIKSLEEKLEQTKTFHKNQ